MDTPAFPTDLAVQVSGMTLRDWYAGQALAGIATLWLTASGDAAETATDTAKVAFTIADAMIAKRNK